MKCQSEVVKRLVDRNMESCCRMYTWLCRTVVALMLQMFWKMRQISDYFNKEETEDNSNIYPLVSEITPLTKEHKQRRHIRSMSDVLHSTPYHQIPVSSGRRLSHQLIYDSESRTRRTRLINRYRFDSTDSSEDTMKPKTVEENLAVRRYKSKDSMRFL